MNDHLRVLVVDDDPQIRQYLSLVLRESGWHTSVAESAARALEMLRERSWPLVFCDVVLGRESGFTVLRKFHEEQPAAQVVLITGHGSAVGALDATAFGAHDYLLKPFDVLDVQRIANAARERLASHRVRNTASEEKPAFTSDIDIIGNTPAFVEIMKTVGKVAPTNLPVLLVGESGTGKEVIGRAIHRRSLRLDKSFVAVNCGALSAELIESELFGHVRGSFTGADRDRIGLWEEAHHGTVFLDEITETSPSFQVKLLRALQEGEIRRVGSNHTIKVDVRVIAATNRDIEREVSEGRFRQDLHFRLNAVTIHLLPLRERRADIMPLAKRFIQRFQPPNDPPINFLREAIEQLESYSWPGNIRELENTIMRAVALCDHTIRPEDLPERIRKHTVKPPPVVALAPTDENYILTVSDWLSLDELEGQYVARVLEHTGGNKLAAARLLKVNRKTLDRMLERHRINLTSIHHASHKKD